MFSRNLQCPLTSKGSYKYGVLIDNRPDHIIFSIQHELLFNVQNYSNLNGEFCMSFLVETVWDEYQDGHIDFLSAVVLVHVELVLSYHNFKLMFCTDSYCIEAVPSTSY